jgi:hypothetical protein
MTEFEYSTTLNGGVVTVYLKIEEESDEEGKIVMTTLDAVYYDGTDVTGILSKDQITALEMEAEIGFSDYAWEASNV